MWKFAKNEWVVTFPDYNPFLLPLLAVYHLGQFMFQKTKPHLKLA